MNAKTLLLIPAALALGAPNLAHAYIGVGFNLAVPLYTRPATAVVYAPPGPGRLRAGDAGARAGLRLAFRPLVPGQPALGVGRRTLGNASVAERGMDGRPLGPGGFRIRLGRRNLDRGRAPDGARGRSSGAPDAAFGRPDGHHARPVGAGPRAAASGSRPPLPSRSPRPRPPEMTDDTEVDSAPPAPIAEYIPVSPYPGYVWIAGYWGWHGGWYWVSGRYARPPAHGAVWVGGGWVHGGRGWVWHRGRWH